MPEGIKKPEPIADKERKKLNSFMGFVIIAAVATGVIIMFLTFSIPYPDKVLTKSALDKLYNRSGGATQETITTDF